MAVRQIPSGEVLEPFGKPLVAIIDIFLKDGECDEVAKILVKRGVPTVIIVRAEKQLAKAIASFSRKHGSANLHGRKNWRELSAHVFNALVTPPHTSPPDNSKRQWNE